MQGTEVCCADIYDPYIRSITTNEMQIGVCRIGGITSVELADTLSTVRSRLVGDASRRVHRPQLWFVSYHDDSLNWISVREYFEH